MTTLPIPAAMFMDKATEERFKTGWKLELSFATALIVKIEREFETNGERGSSSIYLDGEKDKLLGHVRHYGGDIYTTSLGSINEVADRLEAIVEHLVAGHHFYSDDPERIERDRRVYVGGMYCGEFLTPQEEEDLDEAELGRLDLAEHPDYEDTDSPEESYQKSREEAAAGHRGEF